MTTELYSKGLLKEILASIPLNFEKSLIVREEEPNMLQILKLSLRAFLNNILKSPFLDIHGNDVIKALWLLQNIECAKKVFKQYNYLDYFPYSDGNGENTPPFLSCHILPLDVIQEWNENLEMLPYLYGAVQTMKKVKHTLKNEIFDCFDVIAKEEAELSQNFRKLAVNLLFDVGEYNGALDIFIDKFMPIERGEQKIIISQKESDRFINNTKENEPIFNEKNICILSKKNDGTNTLTFSQSLRN